MDVEQHAELGAAGVAVIVDRPGGRVLIDAALDHVQAVAAIARVMPWVHVDVVEQWVEQVLPTAPPLLDQVRVSLPDTLATVRPAGTDLAVMVDRPRLALIPQPGPTHSSPDTPNRAGRRADDRKRRRRHKRAPLPVRVARTTAVSGGVGAMAFSIGAMMSTPASADAWTDPIFREVATAAELTCEPLRDEPLKALCTDAVGRSVRAEASIGADRITYTFSGGGDRAALIVFASPAALMQWEQDTKAVPELYPNLAKGDRVAIWGTDPSMLAPFRAFFNGSPDAEDVAPVVLRASYAMGMMPRALAEQAQAADSSIDVDWAITDSMSPQVQFQAASVLAGDARLTSGVPVRVPAPFATPDPRMPDPQARADTARPAAGDKPPDSGKAPPGDAAPSSSPPAHPPSSSPPVSSSPGSPPQAAPPAPPPPAPPPPAPPPVEDVVDGVTDVVDDVAEDLVDDVVDDVTDPLGSDTPPPGTDEEPTPIADLVDDLLP